MIASETEMEIEQMVERIADPEQIDLEAAEFFIRTSVLAIGARALETLLEGFGSGRRKSPVICACGRRMESQGCKSKTFTSVLGGIRYSRSLYCCPHCGDSFFPGDRDLGIEGETFSPGARRMLSRAGSRDSYKEAQDNLNIYAALKVTAKDVERVAKSEGKQVEEWMSAEATKAQLREAAGLSQPDATDPGATVYVSFDGTGIPMRSEEVSGRKGKQADGSAVTREVKLGCAFTQTTLDDEGRPVRDPHSTTYTGAIETSREFGYRIHAEAIRRGVGKAAHVVCLTDGAGYNKTIVGEHFPNAIHIIDLYHAREKLSETTKLILNEPDRRAKDDEWLALLEKGAIEALTEQLRQRLPRNGESRKEALKRITYLEKNANLMRYKDYREQGFFVGSGVVEAGCKTLIGKRLKQSGMFWSVSGANAIIALRCCQYSGRFEQFWEDKAA